MRQAANKFCLALLSFIVIALLWEGSVRSGLMDSKLFTPPADIWRAFVGLFADGTIQNDFLRSLTRYSLGFVIGNALGVALGVLTGRVRLVSALLSPVLHLFRSTPSVALVPVAILWFGIGDVEKVFVVTWACTYPVWLNTYSGMVEVEREYVWAAKTLGASEWKLYLEVYIPRAVPYIIAGSRVSVSTGWFGLAAAEMAGCYEGIPFRIFHSHEFFRTDEMYAALLVLGFTALLSDLGYVWLMKKVVPWWRDENAGSQGAIR